MTKERKGEYGPIAWAHTDIGQVLKLRTTDSFTVPGLVLSTGVSEPELGDGQRLEPTDDGALLTLQWMETSWQYPEVV
jgi:hypothetical protein